MGITTGHSTTTATSEKHHVSATANVCPSAKLTDARTGVHIPTASQTRSAHVTARRITFLITTGHSTTTATSEKRHVSATANDCPSAHNVVVRRDYVGCCVKQISKSENR